MKLFQGLCCQHHPWHSLAEKGQPWNNSSQQRNLAGRVPGTANSITRSFSQILKPLPGRRLSTCMYAARHYSTPPRLYGHTLTLGRVRQLLMGQMRDALQKDTFLRTGAARCLSTLNSGKSNLTACMHLRLLAHQTYVIHYQETNSWSCELLQQTCCCNGKLRSVTQVFH